MIHSLAHNIIDTVQTTKKQVVKSTVKHDKLADVMNSYIDTQTEYTKNFVNSVITLGTDLYSTVTSPKFANEFAEVYGLDKFVPQTNKKAK